MSESDQSNPDDADLPNEALASTPPQPRHPLEYARRGDIASARAMDGRLVTVAESISTEEAGLHAGQLESAGIPSKIINANAMGTLGLYGSGFGMRVEVQVRAEDAARAKEVLTLANSDDVEPLDASQDTAPAPVDDEGQPIELAVAAAFDNPRALREAAAAVASARVLVFMPTLVPRSDRPAGEGKRFVLRVRADELERAQEVLDESAADAGEDDEPRCPKCKSWRTYPVTRGVFGYFAQMLGLTSVRHQQIECLACRYRGPREEFVRE